MSRKASDRPDNLKEAAISEAFAIIERDGVEKLSLREVARRLGVSHQAPYKHFSSRDHILAAVVARCYRHFAEYLVACQGSVEADGDGARSGRGERGGGDRDGRTEGDSASARGGGKRGGRTEGDGDGAPDGGGGGARKGFADLRMMGEAYIGYAAKHPLQYRLMFSAPLPPLSEHPQMVAEAAHAFSLLKEKLRHLPIPPTGAAQDAQTHDAIYVWATLHGLASLMQSDALGTLALSAEDRATAMSNAMARLGLALTPGPSKDPNLGPGPEPAPE
ncbi:MAG: TetR/AcrR family transcriptional regulator [Pseudomonadota bacterium]